MESYNIVKFGIFDDFSHSFNKETITNVLALSHKEFFVSTNQQLYLIDKDTVKKKFPLRFSTFTIAQDKDFLIGTMIKEGDLNIYKLSDFLRKNPSNNSKSSPNTSLSTFSTNQTSISHIFYSEKSNVIITIGSGVKVFSIKYKKNDTPNDNSADNLANDLDENSTDNNLVITKRSSFSHNYTAPVMTAPAFDKETELILLPTENGIIGYDLNGAKICRCTKNPATIKTIYATYPTKPSKLAKLISLPSTNLLKRENLSLSKEILTYDSSDGMNLWGNKGQLINHYDTIRSSVLSIIFIDSENAICINSCNILFYLNIKTGKTFYYMNLEKSPSRLFLTYAKNEPVLCACFGSYLRVLKLVIPWKVWNLNLEKTLSIRRFNKFMSAARVLIDAENSFIKFYSPRNGKQLCIAKINESYRPVSYFYDRGIVENHVFNEQSLSYEPKVTKINDNETNGNDRDILFIILQNGGILGFNPIESNCENISEINCKAAFMTICKISNQKGGFQWCYAVASEKGDLFIFDYFSMKEIMHYNVDDDVLVQLFFEFDSNLVVMVFASKTILFDIEKGKIIDTIQINGNRLTTLFANFLMYGFDTGHIRRVGIENKKFVFYNNENKKVNRDNKTEIVLKKPHSCPITGFSFAQKIWISSGLDGNIVIWNYDFKIVYKIYLPLPLRSCLIMNGKLEILVATATEIMQIKNKSLYRYLKKEDKIDTEINEIDNFDLIIDDFYKKTSEEMISDDESELEDEYDDEDFEVEEETANDDSKQKLNRSDNESNNFTNNSVELSTAPLSKLLPNSNATSSPSKQNKTLNPSKSNNNNKTNQEDDKSDSQKVNEKKGKDNSQSINNKNSKNEKDSTDDKSTIDKNNSNSKVKNDKNSTSNKNNTASNDKTKENADKSKSADKEKSNSTEKDKANSSTKTKPSSSDKNSTANKNKTTSDDKEHSSSDKSKTNNNDKVKSTTGDKSKATSGDKSKSTTGDKANTTTGDKSKSSSDDKAKTNTGDKSKTTSGDKSKTTSGDKSKTTSGDKSKSTTSDKSKTNTGDKTKSSSDDKEKTTTGDKTKTTTGDKTKTISGDKTKSNTDDKTKTTTGDKSKTNTGDKSKSNTSDKTKDNSDSNDKSKESANKKSSTKTKDDSDNKENEKKISKSNSKLNNESSNNDENQENTVDKDNKSSKKSNQSKSDTKKATSSNENDNSEENSKVNDNSKSNKISKSNSKADSDSKSKENTINDSKSKDNSTKDINDNSNSDSKSNSKDNNKVSASNSKTENDSSSSKTNDKDKVSSSNSKVDDVSESKADSNKLNDSKSNSEIIDSSNDENKKVDTNENEKDSQNEEIDQSNIENKDDNANNELKEDNKNDEKNDNEENNAIDSSISNATNDQSNEESNNNQIDQNKENDQNITNNENNEIDQNKQENENNEIDKNEQENDQNKLTNENNEADQIDKTNENDKENDNNKIEQENENNELNQNTDENENKQENENGNDNANNQNNESGSSVDMEGIVFLDEIDQNKENDQNTANNENDQNNENEINQNEEQDQDNQIINDNENQDNPEDAQNENEEDNAEPIPNENEGENEKENANEEENQNENDETTTPEDQQTTPNNDNEDNQNNQKVEEVPFTGQYVRVPPPNVVIDKDELFDLYEHGRREFKPLVDEVLHEEEILDNWHRNLQYVQNMTNTISSYDEYQKQKQSVKGFTLNPKSPKHAHSARARRIDSPRDTFITENSKSITMETNPQEKISRRTTTPPASPSSSNRSSLPKIKNKSLFYPASYVHNYNNNYDTQSAIATPRLFGHFSSINNMVDEVDSNKNKNVNNDFSPYSTASNSPRKKAQLPPLLYSQPINSDAQIESPSNTVRSPSYNRTAPSPRRQLKQTV